jgi:hypothetical protein
MQKAAMRSSLITKKGKNSISYKWVDGKRVSVWLVENGGIERVRRLIKSYILQGLDRHEIRARFNVSSSTMKNYINKLPLNYILQEAKSRKLKSRIAKSLANKGITKTTKGKTYAEIYGDKIPKCGFRKGIENPNFTRNKYVGCKVSNRSGKKFRSSYEVIFSNVLEENNISYEYEKHFTLLNNKVKIVDFVVGEKLIEVTGYAYEKWQKDFDEKIFLLHKSYPNRELIIISDDSKINILKEKHSKYSKIISLSDINNILYHLC